MNARSDPKVRHHDGRPEDVAVNMGPARMSLENRLTAALIASSAVAS